MSIQILDNYFSFNQQNFIYNYCRNSNFKIGWEDSDDLDKQNYKSIHSSFTYDEYLKSGLKEGVDKISKLNAKPANVVINLTKPGDVHIPHTHNGQVVLLYYVNLEWQSHWAGETLFYDNECKEVIKTSIYQPGRIILFDGEIPHTIRPQTYNGPQFRFTASVFFNKSTLDSNFKL